MALKETAQMLNEVNAILRKKNIDADNAYYLLYFFWKTQNTNRLVDEVDEQLKYHREETENEAQQVILEVKEFQSIDHNVDIQFICQAYADGMQRLVDESQGKIDEYADRIAEAYLRNEAHDLAGEPYETEAIEKSKALLKEETSRYGSLLTDLHVALRRLNDNKAITWPFVEILVNRIGEIAQYAIDKSKA